MSITNVLFILLNAALLVESMFYGLIAPLVPHYARMLDASPGQLGLVFAAYAAALMIASLPAGAACDRYGNRQVLLAGLMLLIASTLLFAWSGRVWLLIISRSFQGIASAAIWAAALAAAAAILPSRQRGSKLGMMLALTGLGTIAGPMLSGFICSYWGYQAPFYITALLIAGVTLSLALLPWPGLEPENEADCPVQTGSGEECAASDDQGAKPAGLFLRNAELILVILLIIAGSFGYGMLEPLLPLHLTRVFHMNSKGIGVVFALASLAYIVSRPVWGYVSDRTGYRYLIMAGVFVTAFTMPVLGMITVLPFLYAVIFLYNIASCAMLTPCIPLLADRSERQGGGSFGKHFGLVNLSYSIGLLLGPALGGIVYQHFSFLAAAVMYSAILLVLGLGLIKFPISAGQDRI